MALIAGVAAAVAVYGDAQGVPVQLPAPAGVASPPAAADPLPGALPIPPDQPLAAENPCAGAQRRPGWSAQENRLPGTADWRPSPETETTVKGYLGEVSGVCGQTIDLHLASVAPEATATVSVYRVGWYGGQGGRLIWTSPSMKVTRHPTSFSGPPMYMTDANWPTSLRMLITPSWTPGYYVLEVRAAGQRTGGESIPFVVRDDSGPSHSGTSPVLFQAAVLTYQAYNGFGDYSTYDGGRHGVSERSRTASFDRPYMGPGYQAPFLYDIPLVAEIEKLGLDADYTTDIDVDQRPSQVAAHRELVVGGHSEYWTTRMYDAAQAARDRGVNLAFFGANTVYWHARLASSPNGADRHMVVYRYADEDPLTKSDPPATTVQWRQAPLNRPEQALVGADYNSFGVKNGAFRVLDPASWIFAGTGLLGGQELPGSVGGEFDYARPGQPSTPPDIDVIAAAPVLMSGVPSEATMSYYAATSGAGVFSGGITYWPCMLDDSCGEFRVPPATSAALEKMTANILTEFAAGPTGKRHPSRYQPGPTPDALLASAQTQQSVAVKIK